MQKRVILKGGIWLKKERMLIEEVKRHPILYEEVQELEYDIHKSDTSWEAVSKQLGLPVMTCKNKWNRIIQKYCSYRNKLKRNPRLSFSKYLDGTLDFLMANIQINSNKTWTSSNAKIQCISIDDESSDDTSDEYESIMQKSSSCNISKHLNEQQALDNTQKEVDFFINKNEESQPKTQEYVLVDAMATSDFVRSFDNTEQEQLFRKMKLTPKNQKTKKRNKRKKNKSRTVTDEQEIEIVSQHDDVLIDPLSTKQTGKSQKKQRCPTKNNDSLYIIGQKPSNSNEMQIVGVQQDGPPKKKARRCQKSEANDIAASNNKNVDDTYSPAGPSKKLDGDDGKPYMFGKLKLNEVKSKKNRQPARSRSKKCDNSRSTSLKQNVLNEKLKTSKQTGKTDVSVTEKPDDAIQLQAASSASTIHNNNLESHCNGLNLVESLFVHKDTEAVPNVSTAPVFYVANQTENQSICITPYIVVNCTSAPNSIILEQNLVPDGINLEGVPTGCPANIMESHEKDYLDSETNFQANSSKFMEDNKDGLIDVDDIKPCNMFDEDFVKVE